MSFSSKGTPSASGPSTPGRSTGVKPAGQDPVNVIIRARPLRRDERDEDVAIRVQGSTCEVLAVNRGRFPFTFDACFFTPIKTSDDQKDVFNAVGMPLVDNAFLGFNSSIIAYGPTGSGKTFTIFGPEHSIGTPDEGLIPRVCNSIFERIVAAEAADAAAAQSGDGSRGPATQYSVSIAVLEIYLEEVFDLLAQRRPLKIRNDGAHRFTVPGLRWVPVERYDDIVGLLCQAEEQKTFAATAVHERSSRAHTLFQVELRATTVDMTQTSRLVLADLAGSERIRVAGTDSGLSLEQATSINMSLLNLGTCIENVVTRAAKKLPTGTAIGEFRNSALTKLLREYIGGNSRTAVVVTVSPTLGEVSNTLQALRFADRAKQLTNHAEINARSLDPHIASSVESRYAERRKRLDEECKLEVQLSITSNREVALEGQIASLKARVSAGIAGNDGERQLRAAVAELQEVRQARSDIDARLERLRETDVPGNSIRQGQPTDAAKRIAELEELLHRAEAFLEAMRHERDEEVSLKNMEMAALRAEYEARIESQSAECEQIVSRTSKCHQTALSHMRTSCDGQVQLLTRQAEAIDSELYAARSHIVTLEEDLACARAAAATADQALREKSDAVLEAAERAANAELEIERALRANDDLRRQLAESEASRRQHTTDIGTLKDERHLLRENIANMNRHFSLTQEQWAEEREQLRTALTDKDRELEHLRSRIAARDSDEARRREAADEALAAAQARVAQLEYVVSSSDLKVAELEEFIESLRTQAAAADRSLQAANEKTAETEQSLREARATVASLQAEIQHLVSQHRADLAKEANQHASKIMALEAALTRVKSEKESLLHQIASELRVAQEAFANASRLCASVDGAARPPAGPASPVRGSAARRSAAPSAWLTGTPPLSEASPPRRRSLAPTNSSPSKVTHNMPLAGMDENTEIVPRMSL